MKFESIIIIIGNISPVPCPVSSSFRSSLPYLFIALPDSLVDRMTIYHVWVIPNSALCLLSAICTSLLFFAVLCCFEDLLVCSVAAQPFSFYCFLVMFVASRTRIFDARLKSTLYTFFEWSLQLEWLRRSTNAHTLNDSDFSCLETRCRCDVELLHNVGLLHVPNVTLSLSFVRLLTFLVRCSFICFDLECFGCVLGTYCFPELCIYFLDC